MFPSLRTRLLIAIGAIVGSMVWVTAARVALGPSSAGGISLFTAPNAVGAVVTILIAGLPAILMGLAISSFSNPMSGLFATAIGLCSLSVAGGDMEGWLSRSDATLPGDFLKLTGETLVWSAAVVFPNRLRAVER